MRKKGFKGRCEKRMLGKSKDSIADHPGEVYERIFAEKVLYDASEHQA